MKDILLQITERLMRSPAAPYHENLVASEIVRIARDFGLKYQSDVFGNLYVTTTGSILKRPFVLAAHMDHPGFVIQKQISKTRFVGRFLGGVDDFYFKAGVKLRLMPGRLPATLGKRTPGPARDFTIHTNSKVAESPQFAVWDLPEFNNRGNIIRGRVCDDLIGVATILTVLAAMRRSKAGSNIVGVLSRAEEVGFHGALALARSKCLPEKSLVISLETSRELPPVKMGRGVIVRVGDRASIFDSPSTRFLSEVAGDLARSDPSFQFQRALMSGGTCEATAYQEYGYQCAAVCVALGNYHNCGKNQRIATEFVNASDALAMAQLLSECARQFPRYKSFTGRLPRRLEKLAREGSRELRRRKLKFTADVERWQG